MNNKSIHRIFLIFLWVCSSLLLAEEPSSVPFAQTAPVIDGKLDDSAWGLRPHLLTNPFVDYAVCNQA